MSEIVSIKQIKRFLDGSVLWIEIEDADTGKTKIISGRELDVFKKERDREKEE